MKTSLAILVLLVSVTSFSQSSRPQNKQVAATKNTGLPASVYYLSMHGAVSDADIGMNSVTFGTDNTSAIQQVLEKARYSPITVYWDGKYSVTGLLVYSNTTVIANAGCGAILRNHSDKSILMNASQTFGADKDSNITISGGIWNGNYYNPQIPRGAQGKGDSITGLVACFRFYGVDNLIVRDAILYKPATYALAAANVTHVLYENIIVDVGPDPLINNDGVHIDGNSRYGVIRHCIINAHDDGVGLNADDLYLHWYNGKADRNGTSSNPGLFYSEKSAGPISDILIEDITFNSTLFGIRILSGQSRVDRITIRNIKGYTQGYALVVDNYQHNPEMLTWAGPGNIGTINVEDVDVEIHTGIQMPNESCMNVSTNVEQLIFKNIKRKYFAAGEPTILIRGKNTVICSMEVDGYYSFDTTKNSAIPHILIDGASVNQLSVSNVSILRKQIELENTSVLLETRNKGTINTLQFSRINTDGIASLISNSNGNLNIINASNVIHTNSHGHFPFNLNNPDNTVKSLTISNFYGEGMVGGTSRIISKKGDAF
jgi:hypothetical protein